MPLLNETPSTTGFKVLDQILHFFRVKQIQYEPPSLEIHPPRVDHSLWRVADEAYVEVTLKFRLYPRDHN